MKRHPVLYEYSYIDGNTPYILHWPYSKYLDMNFDNEIHLYGIYLVIHEKTSNN